MSFGAQVTFDCADPARLAEFWCEVLGYELQPPPEGFASWDDFLANQGIPTEERNSASAAVDPEGLRPRLYFQRVPEGKSAKNRVHLDVNVGTDRIAETIDRLILHGATLLQPSRRGRVGEVWAVLADPEGNEFCLQ
jgi:catechol 2,3-dioxygenase-like lactoylglutathione lyase family enzyme